VSAVEATGREDVIAQGDIVAVADDGVDETLSTAVESDESNDGDADGGSARRSRFPHRPFWLPALITVTALLLSGAAGYLKYLDSSIRGADVAAAQAARAASDSAVAMLSYQPDTVDATLHAAQGRLTGAFRDSYNSLIDTVVIPGAKEKRISVTARIAAAAPMSATLSHAVVLLFIDQTMIIGGDAPSETSSTVQVSLDNVGNRWLISGFDPK
jgi:Mce-associated membrane protein